MINIKNIKKSFGNLEVLKGIDLTVNEGEVVVILGASGSGKTTLLRSINALELPEKGEISIDGIHVNYGKNPTKSELMLLRSKTAMVFQGFNLFPHFTALENITEGLITVKKIPKAAAIKTAESLLKKVGLVDKRDSFPDMLSGGQKQRVAIARALALNPEVILFDEPTSALDIELVNEVLKVMKQLADEGMTMVIVTHEITFAKDVADRILFVDQGIILDSIKPENLYADTHSKRLTEFLNLIEHTSINVPK